ncbi:acyl-CoA desaturase [Nocardioides sp. TF02-7]|uniref:fatty acid desaturase family protein n=1 Tax=Nocardioides sp. TF02-7 TaxID=2917724 RepID=UPI001F054F5C|nr:acyl-CoA desaturase [Nocardioides sp. TF02-7]UMG92129.1 fatty acid desaturase [Nocardioides sp. TF02-7]
MIALGEELDALRQEVLDSRGERDAAYIRRVIAVQRALELGSRVVLLGSRNKAAWLVGTVGLSLAKILDNMEIGHNVLHGQWDWMRDPKIHSATWEWDHASPPEQWQRAHNQVHHTFTNIVGHDNDLGYGIMRVDEAQEWRPRHLVQPVWNLVTACIFEWGIAMYDLDLGDHLREKRKMSPAKRKELRKTLKRAAKQVAKDYVVWPALSLRSWRSTLAAGAVANLTRNLWSHSVIMCGHFPEGVEVFELDELDPTEERGDWYLRQMLGSADISGSRLMHVLTGNLSHQIEHHLFPDLPSNRYGEIAPKVRAVFEKYGLAYCSRPLVPQVYSAWHKVVRLSLPNGWLEETNRRNLLPPAREAAQAGGGVGPRRPARGAVRAAPRARTGYRRFTFARTFVVAPGSTSAEPRWVTTRVCLPAPSRARRTRALPLAATRAVPTLRPPSVTTTLPPGAVKPGARTVTTSVPRLAAVSFRGRRVALTRATARSTVSRAVSLDASIPGPPS